MDGWYVTMISETTGNIWSYLGSHKIVIPTNQIGVMGAGLALQAKKKCPGIQESYIIFLRGLSNRNIPWIPSKYPNIILAPTKRHWKDKSRIDDVADILIKLSQMSDGPFALPEMGCGLGGLSWQLTKGLYKVFETNSTEWIVVHPSTKVR